MAQHRLKICEKQLQENKWYDNQPKRIQKGQERYKEKHKIYKGNDGYYYCETCKEQGSKDQTLWSKPEEYWRLEEIQIRQFEYDEYEIKEVIPLRKGQKITDEALKERFRKLEGKYVEVSKLRIMFGESYEYPDGFIKVNEPSKDSTMTTVISSTYLARLSKITGKTWHQERAFGKNEELLVKFSEGPEDYEYQNKTSRIKQASNLLQAMEALDKQFEKHYDTGPGEMSPSEYKDERKRLNKLRRLLEK